MTALLALGLLLASAAGAFAARPEFFVFDNGVGRGSWTPDQQAQTLKELGYDGISYNYTTPEDLARWQKAFAAVQPILDALALVPGAKPALIETSCCGMAGAFGYQARHRDVSRAMAEASLLPAIRSRPDAIVVADGTSCRQQIAHGAGREALHAARVLEHALPAAAG